MERQEFLSKLGIGVLAVCTGCGVSSCGSNPKANDPTPITPAPAGTVLFTVDLGSELSAIGSNKVTSGVIVVRTAAGNTASSFTAVQVACTHEGTSINYNNTQGIFICPKHGSEFSKSGALLLGPAASALKAYNITVAGSTLTVTA